MSEQGTSVGQDLIWRIEAIGFDLLAGTLRLFPVEAASNFGSWVLRTLGPLTRQQHIIQTNLRIAFPDKDEAWIRETTRGVWDNVGRSFIELPFVHLIMADPNRLEIVGGEVLARIAREHSPTVLVSGHMGNWEVMCASILHAGVDCMVGYRATNNPYVDRRIREARARYGVKNFAQKGGANMRRLLKALTEGASLALLTDQRTEEGISVPFFGRPAMTTPGAVQLALRRGVPLRLMSVQRLPGVRFRIEVHEVIPAPQTGDMDQDVLQMTTAMNAALETVIRAAPEQYFWVHRRWPKATYERTAA